MVSKASIGFEDPKSLEGKKIGTTKGSNTEFFTEALLDQFDVNAEVINVAPPDIVPALARGDIDAGIMFPDFYPAAEKALGEDYREFKSDAYIAWFVLSATPDMLENRSDELAGFVRALIKAEDYIKSNPEGAQEALAKATEGVLSLELIKEKFPEAEYEIGLANGLLDILETQADWVVSKGMVEAEPSRDLIKKYLATGPLEAVDASRITLQYPKKRQRTAHIRCAVPPSFPTGCPMPDFQSVLDTPEFCLAPDVLLTPEGVKRDWRCGYHKTVLLHRPAGEFPDAVALPGRAVIPASSTPTHISARFSERHSLAESRRRSGAVSGTDGEESHIRAKLHHRQMGLLGSLARRFHEGCELRSERA